MPIRTGTLSTIFGSLILQRTNGHGWPGLARLPMFLQAQGYTAHSGLLLQATSQGAGRRVSVGQTRRGISGFGAVRGSMRTSLMAI
jgi:hypothetical protein